MIFRIGIVLILFASSTGCNSIRTTFMTTNECGDLERDSIGCRQGLPVMVKVPTHVEVKVEETRYYELPTIAAPDGVEGEGEEEEEEGEGEGEGEGTKFDFSQELTRVKLATSRTPTITTVFTEKMVLLDPKRPASGSGSFAFGFPSTGDGIGKGSLTSAKYKAVDTTLIDSGNLITTALATFGTGVPTSLATSANGGKVISTTNVIAYKRFPIDCNVEAEIQRFLDQHINSCSKDCLTENAPNYAKGE